MIKGRYDAKVDIWSSGVILYILLCGYPPFNGETDTEIMESTYKGYYNFESEEWRCVSKEAKSLIEKMLEYDPVRRKSAEESLNSDWIKRFLKRKKVEAPKMKLALSNLKDFQTDEKLQEATYLFFINYIASEEEKNELLRTFQELDLNGDGELSRDELVAGFKRVFNSKNAEDEVDEIMEAVDKNHNGIIDYSEFVMATINREKLLNEQRLEMAFRIFDRDNSGQITKEDLKEILGGDKLEISDDLWEAMIDDFDVDGDGLISLEEFKLMMIKLVERTKVKELEFVAANGL